MIKGCSGTERKERDTMIETLTDEEYQARIDSIGPRKERLAVFLASVSGNPEFFETKVKAGFAPEGFSESEDAMRLMRNLMMEFIDKLVVQGMTVDMWFVGPHSVWWDRKLENNERGTLTSDQGDRPVFFRVGYYEKDGGEYFLYGFPSE